MRIDARLSAIEAFASMSRMLPRRIPVEVFDKLAAGASLSVAERALYGPTLDACLRRADETADS